jgi:uncharacterized small protein (DUF1192 family)
MPDMDTDDLEPIVKKAEIRNLEIMSVEAIGAYIAELQMEIKRAEAEIELKKKARQGAEDVFK